MRVIPPLAALMAIVLLMPAVCAGVVAAYLTSLVWWPLGIQPIVSVGVGGGALLIASIGIVRGYIRLFPFDGEIEEGSAAEFRYFVYQCFNLFIFHPVLVGNRIPVPIRTALYRLLGLKIGKGSYVVGHILDPLFVEIGDDSLVGLDAILCSHLTQGKRIYYGKIKIGDHVTIGARSFVFPDVVVEDGAKIGAGAVVSTGKTIGINEVWAGIPARRVLHQGGAPANEDDSK